MINHHPNYFAKTEFRCFNQDGVILLNGKLLKLVDYFVYHGSNISSTEIYVSIRIGKVWTAIDRLTTLRKSDLSEEIERILPRCSSVSTIVWLHHLDFHKTLTEKFLWRR